MTGGVREPSDLDRGQRFREHAETFHDAESYAATKAHELTHWTKHPSRLDRDFGRVIMSSAGEAVKLQRRRRPTITRPTSPSTISLTTTATGKPTMRRASRVRSPMWNLRPAGPGFAKGNRAGQSMKARVREPARRDRSSRGDTSWPPHLAQASSVTYGQEHEGYGCRQGGARSWCAKASPARRGFHPHAPFFCTGITRTPTYARIPINCRTVRVPGRR